MGRLLGGTEQPMFFFEKNRYNKRMPNRNGLITIRVSDKINYHFI